MKSVAIESMPLFVAFLLNVRTISGVSNGERATVGEFPYFVSLTSYGNHFCGGALITTRHVLTAGHCVYDEVPYFELNVGTDRLFGAGRIYRGVDRIAFPKNFTNTYEPIFLDNDIAVVHLSKPVELSATVSTIGLPKSGTKFAKNTNIIVAGYGRNSPTQSDGYLRKIKTKISDCKIINGTISERTFCDRLGREAACRGDSGSPVVESTKRTVIGVVSGVANECGSGQETDVFTNVSDFIDFIEDELRYEFTKREGPNSKHISWDPNWETSIFDKVLQNYDYVN